MLPPKLYLAFFLNLITKLPDPNWTKILDLDPNWGYSNAFSEINYYSLGIIHYSQIATNLRRPEKQHFLGTGAVEPEQKF